MFLISISTSIKYLTFCCQYEFGKDSEGNITLIDEIHTPDSSRYFYIKGYEEKVKNGEIPKQLSKEFVRQWLIENNFSGKKGQILPDITYEKSWEKAVSKSDGMVLLTEWNEFRGMDAEKIKTLMNSPVVLDTRNILNMHEFQNAGFIFDNVGRLPKKS